MNLRRLPALLLTVFLQFAPLVRTVQPVVTSFLQPLMVLLRFAASVTAVAGGAHALSGATGLISATTAKGTNGVPFSYRAQITSDEYGDAKSYSATGLPPGLTVKSSTLGSIGGTPTKPGRYAPVITGYEFSNKTGHDFSEGMVITIVDQPPVITQDPQSQTVTEGDTVTLTVSVTSAESPTFQWIKGGVELQGGTHQSLVFSPVKQSDAGSYTCRVQNSGGIAVSGAGILTVNPAGPPPPSITQPPVSLTVTAGQPASFTVVATGAGTLTYQWKHEDVPVQNATDATYAIGAAQASDGGKYTVVVTNEGGSTESDPVLLTVNPVVNPPPVIHSISGDQTVYPGETVVLTVDATAGSAPSYQWFHDSNPINAATQPILTLPAVLVGDAGAYTVVVTADNQSTPSNPVQVTVVAPLRAGAVHASESGVSIDFNSIAGRQYVLESAASFDSTQWDTVSETTADGSSGSLSDPAPPSSDQRFYRIRLK